MEIAEKVAEILCSRKYNRYKVQDRDRIRKLIQKKTEINEPIPIVGYWGITDKVGASERDEIALNFLEGINQRVLGTYDVGLQFTFLLSDSHAQLNGIELREYQYYLESMKEVMDSYTFNHYLLSDLNKSLDYSEIEFIPDDSLLESLQKGSRKLFRGDFEEGIEKYCSARITEKSIFEENFSDALFFTYNSPLYKPLFPDLPILYLKSSKNGSHPPWVKK